MQYIKNILKKGKKMTNETTQENVQESPEIEATNDNSQPSENSAIHEIMAKKEKIKALEAQLAERDASDEKRRVKKLEEEGKYKELIAEQNKTIEALNGKIESQTSIVSDYKANLISSITSDDERKEELATKSVEFLQDLNKELKKHINKQVVNPQESLGQVRQAVSTKPYAEMTEEERRAHFAKI